jgi:hypothetical protein
VNTPNGTSLRAIVQAMVSKAKGGDMVAAREVLDRIIGKSTQTVVAHETIGVKVMPQEVIDAIRGHKEAMRDSE